MFLSFIGAVKRAPPSSDSLYIIPISRPEINSMTKYVKDFF